ncbi:MULTISPECIES: cache domain-containing protein [Prauserella salsuginis group]|uniref:Cache domain-containing protein n=2 Tax=Prauserella salsuginis group TaxID=2893672 RepID=A0A839Y198_9PSEU|nr:MULTISPECIES: cache domain-containing protein [Prauserella salsuginis group]MBB3665705.1 hypothetical protein [Prauserella sediminis]MCR3722898.1 hypothetical protein [Prauserella flava]MCR3737427.1 hypothetical protein [Prauserella salsuginis]
MNEGDLASLRRSAECIRERIDRVLADLAETASDVIRTLATAERPLRRAALTHVQPALLAVIDRHRGFVQGVGLALDDGHLADAARWMEWWRSEDGEPAEFVSHNLDPAHNYFYDYPGKEWFALPRATRRAAVTGPFVDFGGTNEHTITLAVPVAHSDGYVDVLGADVAVEGVERLLIESLRSAPQDMVLVNEHDRVVASTSARWWSGTLLQRAPGDGWSQAVDVGGHVSWRLLTAHR